MKKYKITFQEDGKLKTKTITTLDISKEILPTTVIKIEHINKKIFTHTQANKIKSEEIADLFFELNIIIQAKIPLYDALEILHNSTKNVLLTQMLSSMMDSLKNGQPVYKALEPYEKHLGNIVISFFKIAQENGNLQECIYSLSILLRNINESKKLIFQKLRYPLVLLLSLILSMFSIFNFVIPQFEFVFEQYNSSLPIATVALLATKNFLFDYGLYVCVIFCFIFLLILSQYKKSSSFRYETDKFIITKIPYFGKLIFLIYFHRFFLSLKILLEANYKFQSCIIDSSILLKNKYLLDRITLLNKKIQKGETISCAFEDSCLFNELTLRLISTGEKSNSMHLSVNEIEKIYKQKLDEKIKLFSSLIEPLFIGTIMLLIVWVILAVLVPMWSMGDVIKL